MIDENKKTKKVGRDWLLTQWAGVDNEVGILGVIFVVVGYTVEFCHVSFSENILNEKVEKALSHEIMFFILYSSSPNYINVFPLQFFIIIFPSLLKKLFDMFMVSSLLVRS